MIAFSMKSVVIGVAVGMAGAGSALAQDTLKWGHTYEVGSVYHQAAQRTAEAFEKATDGRYQIEVFPASQLGNEASLNEALSLGTVDIIYSGPTFMSQSYGPIVVSAYPFALRDYEHWKAYGESDLFKELSEGYTAATGNVPVALTYYGARHVTSNKPILAPEDMEGLKIRTPGAPAFQWFPQAAGANPTPISFSEVYLALQQKVVDAQENPLPTIQFKKFYEVQTNINLTGHITNSLITLVSPGTIARLGDDYATLEALMKENALWASNEIVTAENELADWFRAQGVAVNEVDRAPFIQLMADYLDTQEFPFSKDIYDRLQEIGQ
ncbi:tripartite ATP-independent transporter solute receptor, DctP family [Jannaschia seohaensis]|uniref:Tripartite ATP-independent transporter DctP family solute receptor n=2 Tax=Jannaschia seohaensis TaxID=475081 RepID=A0A2Y9B331_9RHOB|nr:tripartite ATP-independent transporter DctP family solute receptor [Jannaschia seohaensis]SSA50375.1 tripartite ATP-independent transporter solute receptor, DctP family [Jannaschia seohaensis]